LPLLEEQITRTHVFAALDTLEYLRRSGRMNAAVSRLGTLLRIKPLLKMFDGNPTTERVRTSGQADRYMVDLLRQMAPLERVALVHTHAPERADTLRQQVEPILPPGQILSIDIAPVIGAHLGPGAAGFACVVAHKENG
jgi:DegV family protein with EDD domain